MNAGCLPGAFVIEWIDVVDGAAGGGRGLLAGAYGDGSFLDALYAVRIGKHEAGLVLGVGIEVQDAAREHVGGDVVVEMLVTAIARQAADD